MRVALLAGFLLLAATPSAAQSAGERVTASATVIEPGGVSAGASHVGTVADGYVEVATALEIRGPVRRVIAVVEGDAVTGTDLHPPLGTARPTPPAAVDLAIVPEPIVRAAVPVTSAAGTSPRVLTYVVSHIN